MRPVLRLLAFMGRHGSMGFALSIFLGLALPQLAASLRPLLPVTIFIFVALTFARADFSGIKRALKSPKSLAAVFLWMTLMPPVLVGAALALIGRETIEPGLLLGIALIGAGPPLMGFPAYAAVLGLDSSLGLLVLVLAVALTPVVAPSLTAWLAGAAVPMDPAVLAIRLVGLMGGSLVLGYAIRRMAGGERLHRRRHELDGFNVILYFFFAVAAMDGVIDGFRADPAKVALYLAVVTVICIVGTIISFFVLRRLGDGPALVLGIGAGMRNTAPLVAAMGAACPPDTYLFFSMLQFPIYLAPVAVAPFARMIRRADAGALPAGSAGANRPS